MTRPLLRMIFRLIRSRMMELGHERDRILADQKGHSVIGPRPYHRGATGDTKDYRDRLLSVQFLLCSSGSRLLAVPAQGRDAGDAVTAAERNYRDAQGLGTP